MSASHATAYVRARVLAALRRPESVLELAPKDLDLTIRAMRRAQLLGRLAARLKQAGLLQQLPEPARDAMLGALAIADARVRVGRWELNRLATALATDPVVPLIVLKGCAYLLANTPNAAGRNFADVDLLVPEPNLERIGSELTDNGWQALTLTPYDDNYYRVWSHELPPLKHVERGVEIDLHHNILMRTSRLHPDSRLLLAQARRIPDSRFSVLAPIDMTLHAITHLFFGGEMDDALRELCDVDDLMRHFGANEPRYWDGFWARAAQLDLARPAFYGLRYAARLLGTPIPEQVLQASRAGSPPSAIVWLMDQLVPAALFPQHPDRHRLTTAVARFFLFLRSHWVRMPTGLLIRHIAHKFRARHAAVGVGKTAEKTAG